MAHNEHVEIPAAHEHHIVPISTYGKTFVFLLVLMGLTIWVAVGLHIESSLINNLIAMLIAVVKATTVVMIFMGVKYSSNLTKLFAAMGFVFMLMIGLIFCDYLTRQYEPTAAWDKTAKARWTQVNLPEKDPRAAEHAHVTEGGGGH